MSLRAIRKKSGVSLKKLAEKCGITEQYICMIETGQRLPSVPVAKRIAAALGVEWTRFYEQ